MALLPYKSNPQTRFAGRNTHQVGLAGGNLPGIIAVSIIQQDFDALEGAATSVIYSDYGAPPLPVCVNQSNDHEQ